MKKRTVIALIVAAALVITGAAVTAAGFAARGFNRTEQSASGLTEKSCVVEESFDSIRVNTADCDVTFVLLTGGGDCKVVSQVAERVYHTTAIEDGVLKIEMVDERKWYDHIGVFREEMEMTVYLPESQYKSLRMITATGDIEVPEPFYFEEVQLCSATGEVDFRAAVADTLSGRTDTGDLEIMGSTPKNMELDSDTGDISLYAVNTGGEFHIKTDTGSIELEKVNCQILTCHSATGDIELEQVMASVYLQASNDTGDVVITDSDAGEVNIETATGDVSGHFLTPKNFGGVVSRTGKVKVPKTWEGGQCRIETDTGDIHFE